MSELTKEQIEEMLAKAKSDLARLVAHDDERNLGTKIKSQRTNIAILTLALEALEMGPRPISEAPKNVWGIGMVAGVGGSEQMCMLKPEGPAKLASTGQCIFHPTHFVPLSALDGLMEGK